MTLRLLNCVARWLHAILYNCLRFTRTRRILYFTPINNVNQLVGIK
uniref:Uncharacterized protein n=1 Tax=Rhizophora mucronata TaxID=61149 RepID=A0A2P2JA51_RHIMU